jgi:hypothetical protein
MFAQVLRFLWISEILYRKNSSCKWDGVSICILFQALEMSKHYYRTQTLEFWRSSLWIWLKFFGSNNFSFKNAEPILTFGLYLSLKIEVLLICHTTKQLLFNVLVYWQWVDIEKNLIKTIWHLIKVWFFH